MKWITDLRIKKSTIEKGEKKNKFTNIYKE